MNEPEITASPPIRLIDARIRIRRAVAAIQLAELENTIASPFAGSGKAHAVYGELTGAARELAAAQDAFDALCEEKAAAAGRMRP